MQGDELFLRIYGDPVLRARSREVDRFGDDLERMAGRMFEVMYEEEGVGLAAPQVGVSRRVMVLDVPEDEGEAPYRGVIVNPVMTEHEGTQRASEGCLSIPGLREDVTRHARLVVEGKDARGNPLRLTCRGLLARAVQHEIDHLDGILFIDHLSPVRRRLLAKRLKKIAAERQEAAAEQ